MGTLQQRLRRRIGQLILTGEAEADEAAWEAEGASATSPETLDRWLLEAWRHVAASVRPDVLPSLMDSGTGPAQAEGALAVLSVELDGAPLPRKSHAWMCRRNTTGAYVLEDGRLVCDAAATVRTVGVPADTTTIPAFLGSAVVAEAASYYLLSVGGDTSLAQGVANRLRAPYLRPELLEDAA